MRTEIATLILTCLRLSLVRSTDPESEPKTDTSDKNTSTHILFGPLADASNVKYLVQLQKNQDPICEGSIIKNNWVLTATHCIIESECSDIQIVPVTMLDPSIRPNIKAIECHTHDKYRDSSVSYDMALVKVAKDMLSFGEKTAIILLPPPSKAFKEGAIATMVGWGKTDEGKPARRLLTTAARIVSYAKCSQDWKNWQNLQCQLEDCNTHGLPKRSICVEGDLYGPAGICHGDSGGPLVVENMLAGVATVLLTAPDSKCTPGAPAIFTTTADYLPWIYKITDPDKDTSQIFVQPEIYV